jgi:polysaccharide biosynthesis protein PslH
MKILYLAHRIPYPPNKGDKIRSYNEIKYLSQRHEIHLACLADDPKDLKYEDDLKNFCKTTNVILINPKLAKLKSTIRLFSTKPLSVSYFYSQKLQQAIDQLLSTNDYDAIFCFSSPMAEYVFKSRLLVSSCLKLEKSLAKRPPVIRIEQPRTSNQHREPSNQPSASSNEQPATGNHQPSSMNYTLSTMDYRPRTKLIMDFVDVDSDKWAQYAKYTSFPKSWVYRLEAARLAAYERTVAEAFDHCIFVTEAERRIFQYKNPHIQNISVISNGVDLDYFSPTVSREQATRTQPPETSTQHPETGNQKPATRIQQRETSHQPPETSLQKPVIVFTGAMDYYANVDGVVWFTKEILPLIKKEIPEIQFYIVGSNPTKEVLSLSSNNGVTVTGYVPDTREYLRRATVAVVPLRIARGIQNKILEAMAMGIPVVGTSSAFQGTKATIDAGISIVDDPQIFAKKVLKMVEDSVLRRRCSVQAREYVESYHRWEDQFAQLKSLLQKADWED